MNQEVEGRPLILYAADYGQKAVIEYLIAAGADVNVSEFSLPQYHFDIFNNTEIMDRDLVFL